MVGGLPLSKLTSPGHAPLLPKLPLTPGAAPPMPMGGGPMPPDAGGGPPPMGPMDMTTGPAPSAPTGDPLSQIMQTFDDVMQQFVSLKAMIEQMMSGGGAPPPAGA